MTRRRRVPIAAITLVVGLGLLVVTLQRANVSSFEDLIQSLGSALPLVLLPGAAWHLLRTVAWHQSFPAEARPSFARIFRVRLAAEAFSYVTIRGVAGEPLKVVLLELEVARTTSAAAVALERLAYILITALIVSVGSVAAIATLPLTTMWVRAYAVSACLGALIVILPIPLLIRHRSPTPTRTSPDQVDSTTSRSRFRKFSGAMRDFEAQLRGLISGDPRRLLSLIALETAAYFMMALEVWVVFRITHTPIPLFGALAVETLTRVASAASAFIPGNLGALEASNVAAASAVHAAGGALALALVRRLRGLIWCVGGFAVYPRVRNVDFSPVDVTAGIVDATSSSPRDIHNDEDTSTLVVVAVDRPRIGVQNRLGGLPVGERLLRAALRAGYARVLVWTPSQAADWRALASRLGVPLDIRIASDERRWQSHLADLDPQTPVTVLAPNVVASPQLLAAARGFAPDREQPILEVPAGREWPHSGVFRAAPAQLVVPAIVVSTLTPAEDPQEPTGLDVTRGTALLSLRLTNGEGLARAEQRLRESTFKATDGRLGRFNRRLSLPLSIALIRWTRFSPHVMSVLVFALGIVSGWLFSRGSYSSSVLAATVSWAASVLDGCDGELARLQFKESAFGCWLDTLGDYTYYLAIFAGFTIGAVRSTGWNGFWWIGGALLVGTLLTFGLLILLRRRITGERPERLRSNAKAHFYATGKPWARVVAKLSTCATRATAPYGILFLTILGLLPVVVVIAAIGAQIYWISLAVELRRLLDGSVSAVRESVEPAF